MTNQTKNPKSHQYAPSEHEEKIYQLWQEADAFAPKKSESGKQGFTIMMPPPNANDPLHIGHGAFIAIEDVLTRYHRLTGAPALWLPGTDHAGIETQFVFEKKLKKEGKSRFDFDRETLYQMIWDYVEENSDIATTQMKRLGASADWSRFRFMLDEGIVSEVIETFQELHRSGLVYRDLKLVNFSPAAGTAYSNLEINYEERTSPLYYLKYGPFVVATTRPETVFGDIAVAVHPDDERYQKWVGQTLTIPGVNGDLTIKVIADSVVDPEFGTGAVKVTPYHDHTDFEIWQRHQADLPTPLQAIDFSGRLTEITGEFAGQKVVVAREKVVAKMQELGLIEKIDNNYRHSIALCYKTGGVIEPLPMAQFFIKVAPLVKPILEALDNGELRVFGAGHDKVLRHWLTNLNDWNISRQIVWGIRLPVWYKTEGLEDETRVSYLDRDKKLHHLSLKEALARDELNTIKTGLQKIDAPRQTPYQISQSEPAGDTWIQDTDTFDTWFSSAQWPFATFKSLDKERGTSDFEYFYPTTVLETGYDILPFWVMRMLMIGHFRTGKLPFKDVYLHGLIRDQRGRKMSKSVGNVINPLEVVEKFGADALRLGLVIRSTPGLDKAVGEADFKAARNFINKLWNATRFVVSLVENQNTNHHEQQKPPRQEAPRSQEFAQELAKIIEETTRQLDQYRVGLAAESLYNSFWHWYCDRLIEQAKQGKLSREDLTQGLIAYLKLLHPFIPFVTEAIWQDLSTKEWFRNYLDSPLLINSSWPSSKDGILPSNDHS